MYDQEKFRIAHIKEFDIENGDGVGVTLFVQGCTHHCKNCHNPQTWDFNGGEEFSVECFRRLIRICANPNIKRLTISGGDPFDNIQFTRYIADWFKSVFPSKNLWIYTGYDFEDLLNNPNAKQIIEMCDVIVDGEFQSDKMSPNLVFKGSSNQRIIDVQASLNKGKIIEDELDPISY